SVVCGPSCILERFATLSFPNRGYLNDRNITCGEPSIAGETNISVLCASVQIRTIRERTVVCGWDIYKGIECGNVLLVEKCNYYFHKQSRYACSDYGGFWTGNPNER